MSLQLLKCPNCGAPLPPSVVDAVVVCAYCGRSVAGPRSAAAPVPAPAAAPQAPPVATAPAPVATPAAASRTPCRFDGSAASLLGLAREILGSVEDDLYFSPQIPASKERNARAVHAAWLDANEPVLVLYDDTLFGAGDDGFVLTAQRLHWRNILDEPRTLAWAELDPAQIGPGEDGLTVHGQPLHLTLGDDASEFPARLVTLLQSLALGPRRG